MKALENASRRDIAAGKALKPECECGFWMVATPKEKGYLWTCGDPECNKTKFEEVKR